MQRGYRCVLTEPTGERFDPCFVPDLTPSGPRARVFGGKQCSHGDLRPTDTGASARVGALGFRARPLTGFAVTTLIDSRGKLTEAQVHEKLYTEIDRESSSEV